MNYKQRRDRLIQLVRSNYSQFSGPIILFAPCEDPGKNFVQESSFYYFSGIVEPASVMILNDVEQLFYKPKYNALREKWIASQVSLDENYIQSLGFNRMDFTGQEYTNMHIYPYFQKALYENVLQVMIAACSKGEKIFTLYSDNRNQSYMVSMIIDQLLQFVPHIKDHIIDISPQVAQLRRKKDMEEIELLYKAVDISVQAHYAAVSMLKFGNKESDVQAALEYVFTEHQAIPAYPSIVASGAAATILHYTMNNKKFMQADLVVVDAGARYDYYCADITRTYPVSGVFTAEQKELYEMVLECQEIVADQAKPGMWLVNNDKQDESLHHIASNFFKKYGYEQYFTHGIGHFLGLDVHDVGDRNQSLQEGDIITIEPGLYIPEKNIGIRIEDNYWIVDQTTPVCLSEGLPKTVQGIEEMISQSFDIDLK